MPSHALLQVLPPCLHSSFCSAASYYQDKALYAFDCLILVTGDAFREVDRHILLEAQRRKQAVAIVRSKCDTTVQACLKRDRTKTPEAAVQEFQTRYKRELRERLGRLGVDASKVKVFLVNRCGGRRWYKGYGRWQCGPAVGVVGDGKPLSRQAGLKIPAQSPGVYAG